jgi:hypothetical protein
MRRFFGSPLGFVLACAVAGVLGFILLDTLILQIPPSTR